MATNKKTVSVYADDDLLAALEKFKDDEKHKSLNVAIVAILREKLFGEPLGYVQSTLQSNVSSTLDFEAMIAAAIDAKLSGFKASIDSEFIDMKQAITTAPDIEAMVSNAISPLLARLEALETVRSEATAPAKKPVIDSPVESDALPIIEAIEALPATGITLQPIEVLAKLHDISIKPSKPVAWLKMLYNRVPIADRTIKDTSNAKRQDFIDAFAKLGYQV